MKRVVSVEWTGVQNLDDMPRPELQRFANTFGLSHKAPQRAAKALAGDRKNYTEVARDLGHYAWNKLTAMDCRRRGDISGARMYEGICERIYAKLPDDMKW